MSWRVVWSCHRQSVASTVRGECKQICAVPLAALIPDYGASSGRRCKPEGCKDDIPQRDRESLARFWRAGDDSAIVTKIFQTELEVDRVMFKCLYRASVSWLCRVLMPTRQSCMLPCDRIAKRISTKWGEPTTLWTLHHRVRSQRQYQVLSHINARYTEQLKKAGMLDGSSMSRCETCDGCLGVDLNPPQWGEIK
jgi:hypothetical protein